MIRFIDIVLSFIILFLLSPVFVVIYFLIIIQSKGGGFYIQKRVGRYGKDFNLYKFRSMYLDADKKGLLTIGSNDPRVTKIGLFIRRFKIDELPQFINVIKGDMSIVGPRPEVKKYVDLYSKEQMKVLSVRPGITDYASIQYADENSILAKSTDSEKDYIEYIMPDKILLNMKFIENKNFIEYFKIIIKTFLKLIS